MFQVSGVLLRSREAPSLPIAARDTEACAPTRGRLAEGNGPVGDEDGGRDRGVVRAQAIEVLAGGACTVAHALASAMSPWTHAREEGDPSRS